MKLPDKITNEMELSFAIKELKDRFENWLTELKKKGKRTFQYSEWQSAIKDVQGRMTPNLRCNRDVDAMFFAYNDWCRSFSSNMKMRCV